MDILDLRGTKCTPNASSTSQTFRPGFAQELYYPTPIRRSLAFLSSSNGLFSSPEPFILHITSLHHKSQRHVPSSPLVTQDVCAIFPAPKGSSLANTIRPQSSHAKSTGCDIGLSTTTSPQILIHNSHTLARRTERRERRESHERNREAYIERMERIGANHRDSGNWNDDNFEDWDTTIWGDEGDVFGEDVDSNMDQDEDGEENGDGDDGSDDDNPDDEIAEGSDLSSSQVFSNSNIEASQGSNLDFATTESMVCKFLHASYMLTTTARK